MSVDQPASQAQLQPSSAAVPWPSQFGVPQSKPCAHAPSCQQLRKADRHLSCNSACHSWRWCSCSCQPERVVSCACQTTALDSLVAIAAIWQSTAIEKLHNLGCSFEGNRSRCNGPSQGQCTGHWLLHLSALKHARIFRLSRNSPEGAEEISAAAGAMPGAGVVRADEGVAVGEAEAGAARVDSGAAAAEAHSPG